MRVFREPQLCIPHLSLTVRRVELCPTRATRRRRRAEEALRQPLRAWNPGEGAVLLTGSSRRSFVASTAGLPGTATLPPDLKPPES
jgi:hypothetical protein